MTLQDDFQKICAYLNISPKMKLMMNMEWSGYDAQTGVIHVGLKSLKDQFRRVLVHECLHDMGIEHGRLARKMGFYCDGARDKLSEKIVEWIFENGEKPEELDKLLEASRGKIHELV